jgi:hypothetical protein
MMLLLLVLLALLPAAPLAGQAADGEAPSHWREMAREDLEFIHRTLAEHHPGPVDTANPGFATWHERGYAESVALLGRVTSFGGYRAVVDRYVAGFRDGHLTVNHNLDYRWVGWPRFMVAWRGDAIAVHHAEPGLAAPAVGDRLVSCDGIAAEQLYVERVEAFGGKGIPADRTLFVPELFVDRVNPLIGNLRECAFSGGEGERTVTLEWQWLRGADLAGVADRATIGTRGPFDRRDVAGNGLWISLPTFGPTGEAEARAKAIMASLPDHRDRDYVVVDLRGNGGGSSFWAGEFVRQLYGPAWLARLERELGTGAYPAHRVSAGNLAHFEALLPRIAGQAGEGSDFYRYFAALVDSLRVAIEDGRDLYDHNVDLDQEGDGADAGPVHADAADGGPLYGGQLFLLTDAACASACLDFMDVALALPRAIHVGQPTNGDTNYMEIRGLTLPSRNGRLNFATKVYRDRSRGHNQWFTPVHAWAGDIADTAAVEAWVAGLAAREP